MGLEYWIKGLIFSTLLIIASISDIRRRKVEDYISVMIVITAFIGINNDIFSMLAGFLIVPAPLFIAALIKPDGIGGADIKITAASALLLGFIKGYAALIIGLFLAVICNLIINKIAKKNKNESFPLVAYLSAGNLLMYFL